MVDVCEGVEGGDSSGEDGERLNVEIQGGEICIGLPRPSTSGADEPRKEDLL